MKEARAELDALLERYTELHPLVQQKRTQIATLESARKSK